MIIDSIENLGKFTKDFPLLEEVAQICKDTDFLSLTPGSYATKNEHIRYIIFEYELIKEDDERYEAHKIETDVQIVIRGKETIKVAWSSPVEIVQEYVPDIYFVSAEHASSVTLQENRFILLFPGEPHSPCILASKDHRFVKKVVFKLVLPE